MLNELSLTAAVQAIQTGDITSEQLVRDCLDRIENREPMVNAWAFLDPEKALAQAHTCDTASDIGALARCSLWCQRYNCDL